MKFSKADERASVKPSKWKRWSEARREKHRERMWGHIQEAGAGQVERQVEGGIRGMQTGQRTVVSSSEGAQQERSRARQQGPQDVWETLEGGRESSDGLQGVEQGVEWRAEDKTATETIFRSLARKR